MPKYGFEIANVSLKNKLLEANLWLGNGNIAKSKPNKNQN